MCVCVCVRASVRACLCVHVFVCGGGGGVGVCVRAGVYERVYVHACMWVYIISRPVVVFVTDSD